LIPDVDGGAELTSGAPVLDGDDDAAAGAALEAVAAHELVGALLVVDGGADLVVRIAAAERAR
jgi:hypothetical protein